MTGLKTTRGYPKPGIRVAVLTACVVATSGDAQSADVSIIYKNDSDYRLTDNILDVPRDTQFGLELSSRHTLDLLAKTKTDLFRLTPTLTTNVSLFEDSGFKPEYYPGISAGYSHTGKLTSFSADAYFNYSEASSSDSTGADDFIPNRIIFEEEGTQLTYGGDVSVSHKLTKRDSLTWSAYYATTEYQDILTLEPSEQIGTAISWARNWTPLTSTNFSTSVTFVKPEPYLSARNPVTGRPNPVDPATDRPALLPITPEDRVEISPTLTLDTRLTKRLSTIASAGVSIIDEADQAASASFIYSLRATYTLKETSFNAGINRTFGVDDSGGATGTYNFDFGARHQVNDLTSFGAIANFTLSPQVGPDTLGFTFAPFVSYKPGKDWDTTLTYELAYTDEDAEEVWTNSLIFKVSYLKTLLP